MSFHNISHINTTGEERLIDIRPINHGELVFLERDDGSKVSWPLTNRTADNMIFSRHLWKLLLNPQSGIRGIKVINFATTFTGIVKLLCQQP